MKWRRLPAASGFALSVQARRPHHHGKQQQQYCSAGSWPAFQRQDAAATFFDSSYFIFLRINEHESFFS